MLSLVICGSLCCINCATATDGNNNVDVVALYYLLHLLYFTVAGDSAEDFITSVIVMSFKALFNLVVTSLVSAVGTYKQPALAHVTHLIVKLV